MHSNGFSYYSFCLVAFLSLLNAVVVCLNSFWSFPSTRHVCRESWYCFHQNKYPVQDDEYNYRDSLQALLIEGIGDCHATRRVKSKLHIKESVVYFEVFEVNVLPVPTIGSLYSVISFNVTRNNITSPFSFFIGPR